ncbi:MAG: helix-turn-helix domain-containing protein [Patescibacteria group bacterium]|jgi:predicted transcriptional regulator
MEYKKFKERVLRDPEVRKAYDALGPEFALIESLISKRIAKQLTQTALAKKINTKQSAIARLESGKYNPSLAFLNKVAVALDTRVKITIE